jgi:hypothetical protein
MEVSKNKSFGRAMDAGKLNDKSLISDLSSAIPASKETLSNYQLFTHHSMYIVDLKNFQIYYFVLIAVFQVYFQTIPPGFIFKVPGAKMFWQRQQLKIDS